MKGEPDGMVFYRGSKPRTMPLWEVHRQETQPWCVDDFLGPGAPRVCIAFLFGLLPRPDVFRVWLEVGLK